MSRHDHAYRSSVNRCNHGCCSFGHFVNVNRLRTLVTSFVPSLRSRRKHPHIHRPRGRRMREDDVDRLLRELRNLHFRTEQVLNELDELRRAEQAPEIVPSYVATSFVRGDRVYIRNQIRHVPNTRSSNTADRAATVQRVIGDRVEIRTANGYATWRAARNLRPITEATYNEYCRP